MPRRRDHADDLRDALLSLALIPIAGLHTASYWFRETLERTSKLGTDLIASTALGRTGGAGGPEPVSEAVADVLARDLFEAVRSYVRGMVSLPTDSAIYFTGELERRLHRLLAQLQPDATTDLEGYVEAELARALYELDRLALVVRSEAARPPLGRRPEAGTPAPPAPAPSPLVGAIESLRAQTSAVRQRLTPRRVAEVNLDADDARTVRAVDLCRVLATFRDVLERAEGLTGSSDRALLERARTFATDLDHLATRALSSERPPTE